MVLASSQLQVVWLKLIDGIDNLTQWAALMDREGLIAAIELDVAEVQWVAGVDFNAPGGTGL